jgi:hypothetical protein
MLTDIVKTKNSKKLEDLKSKKSSEIKKSKISSGITQTIIISSIIILLAAYIASDILFFKSASQTKAIIVNEKLDSLRINLNKELIKIDNASSVQQQQLKELQNIK